MCAKERSGNKKLVRDEASLVKVDGSMYVEVPIASIEHVHPASNQLANIISSNFQAFVFLPDT